MSEFYLVVRGGTIATAADVFDANLAVRDGRIAAVGSELGPARQEIDARGKLVLPGGIDAHCHLDQPSAGPDRNTPKYTYGVVALVPGGTRAGT